MRAAADRDNQALASWVGSVAMDVAEEVLVPTPVNAKAVVRELIEAHKQLRRVGTNHNQITKVWNSDGRVPDAQMEAVYRALLIAIQRVEAATLQLMRERKERE
ncbi:hypothetical protein [Streptomyces tsukubensis]|uniref:hypothetical protein n=1 Tax=Streptomyces tsukubensis TaxID=83656 RepID=UPI00344DF87E